jgi:hypothetical protein
MEREEFVKDDFLKRLVGRIPLEAPSDSFTSKVMAGISPEQETVHVRKPFSLYLRNNYSWILLGIFIIVFLLSSDIPYMDVIPGKAFFINHIAPTFDSLFAGMAGLFMGSKTLSITIALLASGGLLAAVDWLVRRKSVTRHHTV